MQANKMEAQKEPNLGGNWAHFAWRKVATTKVGNFEVECGHHSRTTAPNPTKRAFLHEILSPSVENVFHTINMATPNWRRFWLK
jgi:hypothetical protein